MMKERREGRSFSIHGDIPPAKIRDHRPTCAFCEARWATNLERSSQLRVMSNRLTMRRNPVHRVGGYASAGQQTLHGIGKGIAENAIEPELFPQDSVRSDLSRRQTMNFALEAL
jgi:hypothetical protein